MKMSGDNTQNKILVFTDNHSFMTLINDIVGSFVEQEYQFEINSIDNFNIDSIQAANPDVIVIHDTPKEKVLSFLQEKEHCQISAVPILIFLEKLKDDLASRYLQEGADHIFCKPWRPKLTAAQLTAVMRSRDKYKQLQQTKYDSMQLFKLTKRMHSSAGLNELIQLVINETKTLLNVNNIHLLLFDQVKGPTNELYIGGDNALPRSTVERILNNFRTWISNLQINKELSEKVILHYINKNKTSNKPEQFLNIVFTNYLKTQDELLGVLTFADEEKKELTQGEIVLASTLSQQLAISIKNILLFETLNYLARKDELTKLFNRRYFNERFTNEFLRNKRYGTFFSCIMADLDHFKSINDEFGHQMGDQVLSKFAQIIKEKIRKIDIAARFGGEEFIILLPETSSDKAHNVAERIRKSLMEVDFGTNRPITASFGVTCSKMNKAKTRQEMISQSDIALYAAKNSGRNKVMIYNEDMSLAEMQAQNI